MRGVDHQQSQMFSFLSPETRVRKDHPLRAIRAMVDEVLTQLSPRFAAKSIQRALKQIFLKVRRPDFNCLEVTKIVENRFLGVPYTTVCVHLRHIEQGCLLEFADEPRNFKTTMSVTNERPDTLLHGDKRNRMSGKPKRPSVKDTDDISSISVVL